VLSTTGDVWFWTTARVGSYEIAPATNLYYRYFDEDLNYFRETTNGGAYHNANVAVVAIINVTNGNVNSILTAFQPIRLFTSADKSYIASMGMPSDKYINLTLGASGSTYTAPANGWVYFNKDNGDAGNWILLLHNDCLLYDTTVNTGHATSVILPINKGYTFQAHYGLNNHSNVRFRFYYAQGSESEAN
jgi:hypothetical protein